MDNFPPNSDRTKSGPVEEKKLTPVVTEGVVKRKASLGKRIKSTFFGGDARNALGFVISGVLIPAAQEAIVDATREAIERIVLGESRKKVGGPPSGASGYVSYDRYNMRGSPQRVAPRTISPRARSQHDFGEIIIQSRQEAEDVIERLFDVCSQYGAATVADLYDLVALPSTHADQKWGWMDLRGAGTARVRDGYLLDLPQPEPLPS